MERINTDCSCRCSCYYCCCCGCCCCCCCFVSQLLCISPSGSVREGSRGCSVFGGTATRESPGQQPIKSGILSASRLQKSGYQPIKFIDVFRCQHCPTNHRSTKSIPLAPSIVGEVLTNHFNFKFTNFNAVQYAVEVPLVTKTAIRLMSCDCALTRWRRTPGRCTTSGSPPASARPASHPATPNTTTTTTAAASALLNLSQNSPGLSKSQDRETRAS